MKKLVPDIAILMYRTVVLALLLPIFIVQMGGNTSAAIEVANTLSGVAALMFGVWLLGPYILTTATALLDKYGFADYERVIHG